MPLFPTEPKPLTKTYARIGQCAAWQVYGRTVRTAAEAEITRLTALIPSAPPPVVTHADEFFDALGHVWWRENGVAFRDGVATPSEEVVRIAAVNGVARQTNQQGNSWDWSEAVKQWVRVEVAEPSHVPVPQPQPASGPHQYGAFWFLAFSGVASGIESEAETLKRAKEFGQTFLIAHADRYAQSPADNDPNRRRYNDKLQALMEASISSGVSIVPCFHGNWPEPVDKEVLRTFLAQFIKHPAIFREKGLPVIACYDYHEELKLVEWAWANGFPKGSWRLWAFKEPWDDNGYASTRPGITGQRVRQDCEAWLAARPEVDGMWDYSANYGASNGSPEAVVRAKLRNKNLIEACKKLGRTSVAGWSGRYYTGDFTPAQLGEIWTDIIARVPTHVVGIAANDLKEGWINRVGTDFEPDGSFHVPPRGSGWTHGLPDPLPDLTHFSKTVLAFVEKFKALP